MKKKALYCATHKKKDMIDVKSKKCIEYGCNISPFFNYKNFKQGLYCSKHKKINMINVKDQLCQYDNCTKTANFNFINIKKAKYCATHKENNMINVRKKLCRGNDCLKEPSYNYENIKTPIYCFTHKKDDMINVKDKNRLCNELDCTIMAVYNYKNHKKGLFCVKHKKDNMIDVQSNVCKFNDCYTLASYNYENEKRAKYCNSHKLDNMINVKDKNKRCKTPLCYTLVTKKYKGYCLFCYIHLFPNNKIIRNYKTKENTVSQFINTQFNEKTIYFDKKIDSGCSNKRPDILFDLGYQVIIIEIDENQHITYDKSCENKRLMSISQDLNHRPLIFIRFNPDNYINKEGKHIKSCWSTNKNGIYSITKTKLNEWNNRLDILKNNIEYWFNNISEKTITIIELFYDNFN